MASAASAVATIGAMSANSSPPRRRSTSSSSTRPLSRSATRTSNSSPAAWPSVSLMSLKPSMSSVITAVSPPRSARRSAAVSNMHCRTRRFGSPVR